MIGSHDTYTFEKPILSAYKASEKLWKTQCVDVDAQYKAGVRMFDIRVARTLNGKWVACHGLVDFHKHWDHLSDICEEYKRKYPDAIYRIVLERGTKLAEKRFKKQAKGLCSRYPNLWRLDIKRSKNWMGAVGNNNQKLYDRGYKFALVNTWEPPAYEIHGTFSFKNLFKTNLKESAKAINQAKVFIERSIDETKDVSQPMLLAKSPADPFIPHTDIPQSASITHPSNKDTLYLIDYCTNQYD